MPNFPSLPPDEKYDRHWKRATCMMEQVTSRQACGTQKVYLKSVDMTLCPRCDFEAIQLTRTNKGG